LILATLCACRTIPPPGVLEEKPAPPPVEKAPVPSEPSPLEAMKEAEQLLKVEEAVRVFREERNPPRALEMLEAFLQMHPESPYADEALLEQARIQANQGEWKKASDLIERLLKDYPAGSAKKAAFIELAQIYSDAERWKDCVEASRNALSLDPLPEERFRALLIGAGCKFNRRDHAGAVSDVIEGYRLAADEDGRREAIWVLEKMAVKMDDRQIEKTLEDSDGSEPYGVLALSLMERHVERGEEEKAISDFVDIVLLYSDSLPVERREWAYSLLHERLLVRKGTIGLILPLSGPYAFFGQKALQGVQAAFGFQAALPGHAPQNDYNLVIRDSGGDPLQTAQAVQDLAEREQALVIIGPLFSRTTQSAALAAEEYGIPLISLSPDPEIPKLGHHIFRRSLLDAQQVEALVEMAHDRLGITRFAFLNPDNSYGKEMTVLFRDEVEGRGGEVVVSKNFEPGQTDFGPQIRSMVQLDRDLTPEELARKKEGQKVELEPILDFQGLFIPADFQTVGMLAPQLAFYDVDKVLLLGTDGWNNPWLLELGEHYVEGALFTGGTQQGSENDTYREMMEKYWLSFGEEPPMVAVQAYDAALIVKKGIESGVARDRASLRKFLSSLRDFPAAEGPLTTSGEGDILQEPILLTVRNGRIVPYLIELEQFKWKIEELPADVPGLESGVQEGEAIENIELRIED